jgi:hypothetical protein
LRVDRRRRSIGRDHAWKVVAAGQIGCEGGRFFGRRRGSSLRNSHPPIGLWRNEAPQAEPAFELFGLRQRESLGNTALGIPPAED